MMFPQFKYPSAYRGAVTEQPGLESPQANSHPRLDLLVVNGQ